MEKLIEGDQGDALYLNWNQLSEGDDSDVTYSTHYILKLLFLIHLRLICFNAFE
jgi:hypothetical protein